MYGVNAVGCLNLKFTPASAAIPRKPLSQYGGAKCSHLTVFSKHHRHHHVYPSNNLQLPPTIQTVSIISTLSTISDLSAIREMSTSVSKINPYNNKPFTANYERIQRPIQSLPVFLKLPQLAAILVNECNVLILIEETGAGKTTQVPKYIFENTGLLSDLKLALTQNGRLATNAVSHSHLSILLDPTVLTTC